MINGAVDVVLLHLHFMILSYYIVLCSYSMNKHVFLLADLMNMQNNPIRHLIFMRIFLHVHLTLLLVCWTFYWKICYSAINFIFLFFRSSNRYKSKRSVKWRKKWVCRGHYPVKWNKICFKLRFFPRVREIISMRIQTPWFWPDLIFNHLSVGREQKKVLNVLHGFSRKVVLLFSITTSVLFSLW
jgi:hypothetical protein